MPDQISSLALSGAAGALVSILLLFLPIVPSWKAKWLLQSDERKQAINALAVVGVTVAVFLLSCTTELKFVECTQTGIYALVKMLAAALLGNSATFTSLHRLAKARYS